MKAALLSLAVVAMGCVARRSPALLPAAHPAEQLDPFAPFTFALASPEDAIVRVVAPSATCSGTLVEEDLVLTAHHCVVQRGAHGEYTKTDLDGSDIQVELGGDYLPWGTVAVKEVVAPPCGEGGGDGDIAVLVLDRKLVGLTPLPARLDAAPHTGEVVDPAGFGRCALSPEGIRRSIRRGGPIGEVRNGSLSLVASICPGDSGGPVFARGVLKDPASKAAFVIGVVSTSAMDADETTAAPTVVARVDAYRSVFSQARLIADGLRKNELPPLTCGK
jgi:hypothetical protein